MAFTRAEFEAACTHHHAFAETMHRRDGVTYPILLLLCGDLQVEAIALIDGVPGPAGTAMLRRRAAAVGALAAVYACEAWIGIPSIPPDAFARLDPRDMPRPAEMNDRLECVLTCGVYPAGQATVHRLSVIERVAGGGSRLRTAQEFTARDYGTNQWLGSLLVSPVPPTQS